MNNELKTGKKFLGKKIDKFLQRKNKKRIAILAATVLAASGGIAGIAQYSNKNDNSYKLVQANDILGDEYEGNIPIELYNGSTSVIDNNEFIIVKDDIKNGENDVIYISPYNELIQGKIDSKYLKESKFTVSENLLKEYKYVYKTIPKDGANIRSKPRIDDSLIVSTLGNGELVLASTEYISANDGFSWIPIVKINQYGIYQGYVRSDLLQREGSIKNGKFDDEILNTIAETKETVNSNTNTEIIEESNNTENLDIPNQENSYKINQDEYIKNINKKVNTETTLNCRENPSTESSVITKIPSGAIITATGRRTINDERNWIEVIIKNENENITGWVVENYLEDIVVKKKIDTSMDEVNKLNMRKEPGFDSEIIMEIESNKNIEILEQNFNNPIECDGLNWIKIKINGQIGYIASKYLKDIEKNTNDINETQNMEIYQRIKKNLVINKSDKITGIDVAFATGDKLERMIQSGINQTEVVTQYMGTLNDISDIASSKINFVMIGIGAMHDDSNTISDRQNAMEAIKKCEEKGIPYGLYYYSGCINNEEAQQEYNYITNFIESLKSINPKYNLMPFALDVEINNVNVNRQAGKDVTDVKAYLANLLQKDNKDIILYTAQNAASTTNEINGNQCISLPKFKEMTGIDNYWYVAPKQEYFNSDMSNKCKEFIKNTPSDLNVAMQQVILDGNINGVNVDVDVIEKDYFDKCIRKALNIDEIEQNMAINEDEER